jgi:hypothetical protein
VCYEYKLITYFTGDFVRMNIVRWITNELYQAAFITKIDKYDPAMVAVAVRPSAQYDLLADVYFT